MPKYRYIALATASLMVLGAPAGAAYAASAHKAPKPVLRIGTKGGAAVEKGAVLTASLASHTSMVLSLGSFTAKCKTSKLTAEVTGNPSKPGKAALSVTGETIGRCKLKGAPAGVTLKSITALNLPYGGTVSTATGDPVTITESKSSKPLGFKASIALGTTTLTCIYTAPKVSGHASNKGNKVSFAGQKLSLDTGKSNSLCAEAGASAAAFSATYGPVRDTSAKRSPKVFVS